MTTPDAHDRLRTELLRSSLYDDVPLALVESVITRDELAQGAGDQQELALAVIRSLVEDGLMKFEGWDGLGLDEALHRVRALFVEQYDDPAQWAFAVWRKPTESGRRAAEALKTSADQ